MISNKFLGSKSYSNKKLLINSFNLSFFESQISSTSAFKRIIYNSCNNSLKSFVIKSLIKIILGLVILNLNDDDDDSYFIIFESFGKKILLFEISDMMIF